MNMKQNNKTANDLKDIKLDIKILLGLFKKAINQYGKGEILTHTHIASLSSVRAELMDSLAFVTSKELDEIYRIMKDSRN